MMNRKTQQKLIATIAFFSIGLGLTSCSSEEETLKPLGESPSGQQTETENTDTPTEKEKLDDNEDEGDDPEEDGYFHGNPEDIAALPTELVTRPEGVSSQDWWLRGGIMDWWFGNSTNEEVSADAFIAIWTNPNNSDVGSPEMAQELSSAGQSVLLEWAASPSSGQTRGALPPAENVVIQGVGTALAYRPGEGPQLYRVAVLWAAEKDPEFQKPVYNQMTEMYFTGTPGNWTRVPCAEAGPSMCVPLFQKII